MFLNFVREMLHFFWKVFFRIKCHCYEYYDYLLLWLLLLLFVYLLVCVCICCFITVKKFPNGTRKKKRKRAKKQTAINIQTDWYLDSNWVYVILINSSEFWFYSKGKRRDSCLLFLASGFRLSIPIKVFFYFASEILHFSAKLKWPQGSIHR